MDDLQHAGEAQWAEAVRVIDAADTGPLTLNANTLRQNVICYRASNRQTI